MTRFAHIRRRHVTIDLACRVDTVVTTKAIARNQVMIHRRAQLGRGYMTNIALLVCRDMSATLARRYRTVMTA